jgi:hypothetical protein
VGKPTAEEYDLYLYGEKKSGIEAWGWWTINKQLEAQARRYDPNRLLKFPAERDIQWDINAIRDASSDDLGDMLSYFAAQTSFIGSELGLLSGALVNIEMNMETALAKAMNEIEKEFRDKRRPLKANLEAEALHSDPILIAGRHEQIELTAKVKVAQAYYNSMDRMWQTASREITRREQEWGRRHG